MRNARPRIFLPLLCAVVLCCGAAALAQTDAGLVGTWQSDDVEGRTVVKLNADGTGSLDGAPFTYVVQGDKIVVTINGATTPYAFKLTGGVLSISNPAGQSYTFERVGAAEASARGEGEQSPARARNPLVGRWVGDDDTVDIREDGTLYLSGMKMTYKVEGDRIKVTTDRGEMVIPFRMNGDDKFTVTIEGREIGYERQKDGPGGGVVSGGAGANPQELAGKWCYMANVSSYAGGRISNRCFTLREDGTYEYYAESSSSGPVASSASQESDSGTWTATATTITSRSSRTGTNTYKLERRNHPKNGDPMLVLDGDAYVTATQRPSWP